MQALAAQRSRVTGIILRLQPMLAYVVFLKSSPSPSYL
ncbi:hypothetical protein CFter6_1402 [Collimonas fungivorans]|uniref:Uncharacterized protein n=1 Tax=Collimonas fungivorans TaxID=158899 RepID=A0A127P8G4_9BURK|nr:hypothetical protein CFter6_1402 [Collimonas fungivorans]